MSDCVCGLTYSAFRTGESFDSVRQSMWVESADSTLWRHKTRHMVLGHWREIKLRMWGAHTSECAHYARTCPEEFQEWLNR